jgi:hypothetical protein
MCTVTPYAILDTNYTLGVVHTNIVSFFHGFSGVNWPKLRNDVLMDDNYGLRITGYELRITDYESPISTRFL